MEYTISQVAERFNLTISQIRYYDKEGLLPDIKRVSGIRKFTDADIEVIFIIECLKKSGLQLKEIKQFIEWTKEGDKTIPLRLDFFINQEKKILNEINKLDKALSLVRYKIYYYTKAKELGTTSLIENNQKTYIPKNIQKLYDNAHK